MTLVPVASIDTNILVSSFIAFQGNEAQIVEWVREERLKPAISTPMMTEYRKVLTRAKFRFHPEKIEETLATFVRYGRWVAPDRRIFISPHEPDNRLLECAEAANADFLITGNLRHFPATHGRTRILNAKSFLDVMQGNV